MGRSSRFSPEVRERAVRMVEEHREAHASAWAVLQSVAPKLGCTAGRRCGSGCGRRSVMWASAGPDDERAGAVAGAGARGPRTEASERDPAEGVRIFRPGGARPPGEVATMVQFIDDHRDVFGVEPICAVLPIAPSTDSSPSAPADPSDAPVRAGAARRSAPRRDSAGL